MDSAFKKAIEELNKIYNPKNPELLPFDLTLNVAREKQDLVLEVRRRWKINLEKDADANTVFAKKFIQASFTGKPIIATVVIKHQDAFRAKAKAKSLGLL